MPRLAARSLRSSRSHMLRPLRHFGSSLPMCTFAWRARFRALLLPLRKRQERTGSRTNAELRGVDGRFQAEGAGKGGSGGPGVRSALCHSRCFAWAIGVASPPHACCPVPAHLRCLYRLTSVVHIYMYATRSAALSPRVCPFRGHLHADCCPRRRPHCPIR